MLMPRCSNAALAAALWARNTRGMPAGAVCHCGCLQSDLGSCPAKPHRHSHLYPSRHTKQGCRHASTEPPLPLKAHQAGLWATTNTTYTNLAAAVDSGVGDSGQPRRRRRHHR